jgi:hypothetical protein
MSKHIGNIDLFLLDYVKKVGWGELSKRYIRAGKERIYINTDQPPEKQMSTTVSNVLEFIGSYRKVLIDYIISQSLGLLKKSSYKKKYSHFLNRRKIEDTIHHNAFGSTNPTSDYDLTISGPGSYLILEKLIDTFCEMTDDTMAFVFDSNFYIVPDLVVFDDDKTMYERLNIDLFFPFDSEIAIPIPDKAILKIEKEYILKKMNKNNKDTVIDQYRELISLGKKMDKFAYERKKVFDTNIDFFKHIFEMNRTAIEAYYGLSTILVVVYGIQAKKMEKLKYRLSKSHFENACLENLIDFSNHWNHYMEENGDQENSQTVFVKLSKYLQRVILCVNEIEQMTGKTFEEIPISLREEIENVVSQRSKGILKEHINLSKYGLKPNETVSLSSKKEKGMLQTLYRQLIRKKEI